MSSILKFEPPPPPPQTDLLSRSAAFQPQEFLVMTALHGLGGRTTSLPIHDLLREPTLVTLFDVLQRLKEKGWVNMESTGPDSPRDFVLTPEGDKERKNMEKLSHEMTGFANLMARLNATTPSGPDKSGR